MKNSLIFILGFICFHSAMAQKKGFYKISAESGDGIYSLLRKQGLDPVKHYAEFIALNEKNLTNGSELRLDREYLIPDTPDSYRKKAVSITNGKELSLFEKELAQISPKSEKLKNAVIYLMAGQQTSIESNKISVLKDEIMQQLAEKLMVHGAQVYLVENKKSSVNIHEMGYYVETINKRYLKNSGKYQRLLLINLNKGVTDSKYFDVSVFHHDNSALGERFAENIQHIFNENRITKDRKTYTEVFSDKNTIYLAKNALPAITLIDIGDSKDPNIEERIAIGKNEKDFTNMITSGVLNDYADIEIEE